MTQSDKPLLPHASSVAGLLFRLMTEDVTTRVNEGVLRGRSRRGIELFAGIPYAAPPTGSSRFRAPKPPEPWEGTRDARRFGPAAPQLPGTGLTSNFEVPWDEDCLTLNVVTPACDQARRPVYVWIHGGSYKHGQGATPWYDGTSFATRGDLVVVTINYRLGALGFCDLGSHLGNDFATCGINGTLDQVAALNWIKANIGSFGGDPDCITVGGESAGAFSVCNLLAMEAASGLFHRAIAQSGACHHTFDPTEGAVIAKEFLDHLDNPSVDDLMALPVETILTAQERVSEDRGQGTGRSQEPFYPVWGHELLPRDPRDLMADGAGATVPLLTGTNEDEMALWGLTGMSADALARMVGNLTNDPDGLTSPYQSRLDNEDSPASPGWMACAIATDRVFGVPAVRHAEYRHPYGADTWMYRFSWDSRAFDGLFGAAHALEIPFTFNTVNSPGVDTFLGPGETPTTLAETMHDAWIAFIRDGDPSTTALGPWPRYTPDTRAVMELDTTCSLLHDPRPDERQAWNGLIR